MLKIVVYVFGIEFLGLDASVWLTYVAAFTLLSSSIIALSKDNLKARLAYSTISQLAYIVLGAAIATEASVLGGGLHIAMHAIGKITLFFCAGAIYVALHKKKISEMKGIGRQMPFTMVAFFLGSLCIIGVPPMGGSWSKWYLAIGAIDADQMIFVVVLMVSSLLSSATSCRLWFAFFSNQTLMNIITAMLTIMTMRITDTKKHMLGKAFGDSCMKHRSCVLCRFYDGDRLYCHVFWRTMGLQPHRIDHKGRMI